MHSDYSTAQLTQAPPETTNTAPHLNQKKTNENRAQTTTTLVRPRSPPPTMGRDQHNLVQRALLTSTLLTLATATLCHLSTSQLYHLPNSATMTIRTQSSSVKTRAAKADALATLRPRRDVAATHGLHEARASTPTLPSSISLAYSLMGDWRCLEREDKMT